MPKACTYISIHQKQFLVHYYLFYDLGAKYPSIFNNVEHAEEAIRSFELQTFSKFSVYQKDKNFGAHGEYILHEGLCSY